MRNLFKRSLSIFIAIIMVFSLMAVSFSSVSAASYFNGGNTLYLRPNSQWKMDSARFAAYFFTSTDHEWVDMKDTDGDGYYEVTIPDGYWSTVIFCRMNPAYTDNDWSSDTEDRLWHQTADLSCDGVNDCYEMKGGAWEEGSWSVYAKKLVYFVNTKGWSKVYSYCVNTSLAGNTWPGKATKVINKDMGVYAVNPGNYPLITFTDGTSDGEYTAEYNYADVAGKYIEPITGGVYTSAAEALTYANSDSAFFVNTLGWSNVNGYGWTDGIGSNTSYPGKKATLINDEKGVYAYNAGDRKQVSFNDGTENGSNTDFFTYSDVKGKYIEPKTGKAYNSAEEAWAAASSNIVYFVNTLGWSNVNGYGWTDGIGSNTAYPGTKATLINSKYSVYSYDPGDRKQVLFNDGTETGEYSDYFYCSNAYGKYIEPKTGAIYNTIADAINASKYAEPPATQPTPAPTQPTTTEPTDLHVTLSGDFNGWSQTANVFEYYGGYDYQASITIPAGTYNFKIVHEGLWHGNGTTINDSTDGITLSATGSDCTLKASGGQYDFYYNASTHKLSILYTKVEVEGDEEEVAPTVLLSGSFNAWANDDVMTGTSGTVVEKSISLDNGQYYFNIVENGSWYATSYGDSIYDTINDDPLVVNGGVITFNATGGDYTFSYDYEKNTLTITASIITNPAELANVYLAGDFNNWNYTANKLTPVDNYKVSTSVTLSAGTYTFKMVDDDLWYGNDGIIKDTTETTSSFGWAMQMTAGNCTLKASGGTYTFTYDVVGRVLTVSFVASDEDYAENAKVYLAGDFNNWNKSSDLFEYSSKNVISKTIELTPGTYGFKLVEGDLWYGNAKTFNNTVDNLSLSYTGGNCILNATGGKYTFTYNVADKVLTITFVASDTDLAQTAVVSVAGEFNDWSQTTNKLTRYSKNVVTTTFDIKGGTYKFKIVHDGLWYGNEGTIVDTTEATSDSGWLMDMTAAECTLKATGGTYTFMYNVVTKALTVTAEISAEDPAKTADACVSGDFNGWSLSANKLTYSAENTVSTTFDIPAGTYKFKIVHDGLWYGNEGTIVDTTTTTSNIGWKMEMTAPECTLKATGGTYTFTYNVMTGLLVVTATITAEDPAKSADACVSGEFNGWSLTANKLTYSAENTVSTTFDIPAGTYKFKIVNGGLWYGNNGTIVDTTTATSSNGWDMSMTAPECTLKATGGTYTFDYNVMTGKLVITSVITAEDPAKTAEVYLAGDFNGWSTSENALTYTEENIVSTSVFLFPGTYKFKIVEGGLWYGNNGTITNTTGLSVATAWEMNSEAPDCTLTVDGGTFTFNYNVVTKKLQVLCALDDYDPAMYSDVRLVGDFNNWDTEATKMIYVDDRAVVIDVELEAGQYQFKIIEDGVWYGNNGTIPNVTTSSDIGWTLTEEEGNCTLDAQGGKYTFIYRVVPNTIIVFHNYEHNWF